MAKASYEGPADKLELYEKLVATNPKIGRKGAANPYTSHNGHMFSMLDKTGTLILRLPKDDLEAFLKKYQSKRPIQYGIEMKEYVEIPDALLRKTSELKKYFDKSYAYICSLKPKPTKRK